MRATIGHDAHGRAVALDIEAVLRTRLLIQASSGGGKSWLLRRLAEQLFGHVQVIIIDPEGEFATLRERYGYVLVGKGGETPADTRSAALVAHKLLELNASAVCDLFEMAPAARSLWVKLFLDALIDAPKRLWRPLVVIVDESHVFAPERGDSTATDAVVALATRGRKRGFAAVLATQRLAKLRKDVAAECGNVLIGRTMLDVDRDRAVDALGIGGGKGAKDAFAAEIKLLKPGGFYAQGPALCDSRTLVRVGTVETSHHEPGSSKHAAEAPPTPEKVKRLLPQLADLPKEAETKARTEAELRQELARLTRELAAKPAASAAEVERVEVSVLKGEDLKRAERLADRLTAEADKLDGVAAKVGAKADELRDEATRVRGVIARATAVPVQATRPAAAAPVPAPRPRQASAAPERRAGEGGAALPVGERLVLTACAQHDGCARDQLSILTGYKRSTRDAYVQRLRERAFVEVRGDLVHATDAGIAALGPNYEPLPAGDALRAYWMARLPDGEGKVLEVVCAGYPDAVERTAIDDATGYKRSTRDAYVQRLTARRLVTSEGRGAVRASEALFG